MADHVGKGTYDQQHWCNEVKILEKEHQRISTFATQYDLFRRPSIYMKKKYIGAINKER